MVKNAYYTKDVQMFLQLLLPIVNQYHHSAQQMEQIVLLQQEQTKLQISIIGTDGKCGWLQATETEKAQCRQFNYCELGKGTTEKQCLQWGSTCISDKRSCLTKSTCSSYTSFLACRNAGTDGTCIYVAGICRLKQCSDATTVTALSISTHNGCVGFLAFCTTSGTGCINQSTCISYKLQENCVMGTDGQCFWSKEITSATESLPDTTSSFFRLKQCTDIEFAQSSLCNIVIVGVKYVFNGIKCISQSNCSNYTEKEACSNGGTDGICIFIQGQNETKGICDVFKFCTQANTDIFTCKSRQDVCYFNSSSNGVSSFSCLPHTCETKALGSYCQPVPSSDLSSYQICVLNGTACVEGNPSSLTSFQCFEQSIRTHNWNPQTNLCQLCESTTSDKDNTNNTNNTNRGFQFNLLVSLIFIF